MLDYFDIGELRYLPQVADSTKYPDARCEASAAYIVGIIEREVDTSFVERTTTDETYDGSGSAELVLRDAFVRSVSAVKVDGTAVSGTFAARAGVLRGVGSSAGYVFPPGVDNIAVTYVSGYSAAPPPDIKEAALQATRNHLLATAANSAMDARRTSLSTEAGTVTFVVAGSDHPTGYPDVDAVIVGWRNRLNVFGFA